MDKPEPASAPVTLATQTEQEFDYDRTVALSDGVFAIALTLLVLSIDVPEPSSDPQVWEALGREWRDLFSYAVSVGVIGLLWMRHHTFFAELVRVDARLSGLNIAYLGLVAFVPFPTELVGDNQDEPAAVVLYAVTVAIVAVTAALMRLYAERAGLLSASARREPLWSLALVPTVFLASIPIAFVSPVAAQLSWLVVVAARRIRRSTAA